RSVHRAKRRSPKRHLSALFAGNPSTLTLRPLWLPTLPLCSPQRRDWLRGHLYRGRLLTSGTKAASPLARWLRDGIESLPFWEEVEWARSIALTISAWASKSR